DGDDSQYNINTFKLGSAKRQPFSSAVDAAVEKSESVLDDIPDMRFRFNDDGLPARCKFGGSYITLPEHVLHIDDLALIVYATHLDGPGGVLAAASICGIRSTEGEDADALAALGVFAVDEADIPALQASAGGLVPIMVHEIGHVLGIGTLWHVKDPVGGMTFDPDTRRHMVSENPFVARGDGRTSFVPRTDAWGSDIAFLGMKARDAFVNADGDQSEFTLTGTPIATTGGRGSFGAHWSERIMDNELMTPVYNRYESNLFSAITVQSMQDLGYEINSSYVPDPYTVPMPSDSADVGADANMIDLSHDVLRIPIDVIGPNGEVEDVIMPPRASDEEFRLLNLIGRVLSSAQVQMEAQRRMELDVVFTTTNNENDDNR
ncbi:MAG: hypothetical protein F4Y14_09590, partial [Acidobacteria bacterium]|nr:hypothetical protein [Acidobacteriota bacterium]